MELAVVSVWVADANRVLCLYGNVVVRGPGVQQGTWVFDESYLSYGVFGEIYDN